MKKILADFDIYNGQYRLKIPTIKNYKGNLTKTKNYIQGGEDDHDKKIKKNDPLFEFALYDRNDTSQHGFLEFVFKKDKSSKEKKILITSPVSAIFKYKGYHEINSWSLGKIYFQKEAIALLDLESQDKEKNIDKKNKLLQEKIKKLKE